MMYALILWRSGFGLVIVKFHLFVTVICPQHDNSGVLSFHIFIHVFVGIKYKSGLFNLQLFKDQADTKSLILHSHILML